MPRGPGGIRCRTSIIPDPQYILELAEGGREVCRVLWGGVHVGSGSDAVIPVIAHHFQCGDGCGSDTLGVSDSGGLGRVGQAQTRRQT